MKYHTVLASKPGTPAPKIEKRTLDSKIFAVDVTPLLAPNESVYGPVSASFSAPLLITEMASKQGKYVIFRAEGGPLDMPFQESSVVFSVSTSNMNTLSVPVTIKAYSV